MNMEKQDSKVWILQEMKIKKDDSYGAAAFSYCVHILSIDKGFLFIGKSHSSFYPILLQNNIQVKLKFYINYKI